MRSPLYYFAAFVLCLLIGSVWLLAVAAPVLIGLPVTPDNIGLAVVAGLPTIVSFIGAFVFSIKMSRAK